MHFYKEEKAGESTGGKENSGEIGGKNLYIIRGESAVHVKFAAIPLLSAKIISLRLSVYLHGKYNHT